MKASANYKVLRVLYMIEYSMLVRYRIVKNTYDKLVARIKKRCGARVKIPSLTNAKRNSYTILGLCFVFFGENLGKVMHKRDLLAFLKRHGVKTSDPQPRHLGMQFGMDFLVMNSKHPHSKRLLRAGEYCLRSLSKAHPLQHCGPHRHTRTLSCAVFNRLKKKYHGRCACCGSLEDEPNFKNVRIVTKLERGHMDPRKPLDPTNCIPLCCVCNKVYKNKFVFNARGFVKPIKL